MPNGVVAYMREKLGWDVLFVIEHDDLRRARDIEHYRLARQLGRLGAGLCVPPGTSSCASASGPQ